MTTTQSAGYNIPNFNLGTLQKNSDDEVSLSKTGLKDSGTLINEIQNRVSLSMSDLNLEKLTNERGKIDINPVSGKLERPILRANDAESEVLLDVLLNAIDELQTPEKKSSLATIKSMHKNSMQAVIKVIEHKVDNIQDVELKAQVKDALAKTETMRQVGELALAMIGFGRGYTQLTVEVILDDTSLVEGADKTGDKGPVYAGFQNNDVVLAIMKILREVLQSIDVNERKMNADLSRLSAQLTESAAQETIRQGVVQRNAAIAGFVVSGLVAGMGATVSAHGLHKQNKAVKTDLKAANSYSAEARAIKLDISRDAGKTNKGILIESPDGKTVQFTPDVKNQRLSEGQAQMQERYNDVKALSQLHAQNYDKVTNNARFQTQAGENALHMNNSVGQVAQSGVAEEASHAGAANQVATDAAQAARSAAQEKDKQIEKSHSECDQIKQQLMEMIQSKQRTTASVMRG